MRKLLTCIFSVMLLAGLLSACSGGNDSSDGKVTIKFMHRWTQEPDNTFFKEVVKDFEKKNPNINVDIQAIANDPYKEKIKIILGTKDAPDVFFTWPGEFTNRFIRADKIMDLTEEMGKNGWKDSFVNSQLQPFELNNKIYGAPYRVDGKVFVYNKKLFDEAGVQVPTTWEEFVAACQKLDEKGIVPIAFGNQEPWAVAHYIGTLNQKMVPDDVRKKDYQPENGEFTDSGYVEALKKYEQIVPFFNKQPNAIKHDEARVNFLNGKAAMMYVEIVEIPEIERAATKEFKQNYGVFNFPVLQDGKGNQNYLTGYPEGFVVSANTKHPKEAIAFLKYLTGKEAGMKEAKDLGFINGIKNVVSKGDVPDSIYDNTQIVLKSEEMVNWLDADLHAKIVNPYLSDLQKLTDGKITPEEVMKNVQKAAGEVKKEFNN